MQYFLSGPVDLNKKLRPGPALSELGSRAIIQTRQVMIAAAAMID